MALEAEKARAESGSLRAALQAATAEKEDLATNHAHKMQALEAKLQLKAATLEQTQHATAKSNEDLSSRLAAEVSRCEQLTKELQATNCQLADAQRSHSSAVDEIQRLASENDAIAPQLAKLRTEVALRINQVETVEAQREEARKRLERSEAERADQLQQLTASLRVQESIGKELHELRQVHEPTKLEHAAALRRVAELEENLLASERRAASLVQESLGSKEQREQMLHQFKAKTEQLTLMYEQVKQLTHKQAAHDELVERLMQSESRLRRELDQAQTERESYRQHLSQQSSEHTSKLIQLSTDNAKASESLASAQQQLQFYQAEQAALRSQLEREQSQVEQHRNEANANRVRCAELSEKLESVTAQHTALQSSAEGARKGHQKTLLQLEGLRESLSAAGERISVLEADADRNANEMARRDESIHTAQIQLHDAEGRTARIENELETAVADSQWAKDQLSEISSRLEAIHQHLQQQQAQGDAMRPELAHATLGFLHDKIKQLTDELRASQRMLRLQAAGAEPRTAAMEQIRDATRLLTLEVQTQRLETENESMRTDLAGRVRQVEHLQKLQVEQEEHAHILAADLHRAQEELRRSLESKQGEVSSLEQRVKALTFEVNELRERCQAAKSKSDEYEERFTYTTGRLAGLEKMLEAKNAQIAMLSNAASDAQAKMLATVEKYDAGVTHVSLMESRCAAAESDAENERRRSAELLVKLESADLELKGTERERSALQGRFESKQNECVVLDTSCRLLQSQISKLSEQSDAKLRDFERDLQLKDEQLDELTAAKNHLVDECRRRTAGIENLEAKLNDASGDLESKKVEIDRASRERELWRKEKLGHQETVQALRDSVQAAESRAATLSTEAASLRDELLAKKQELDARSAQCDGLLDQIKQLAGVQQVHQHALSKMEASEERWRSIGEEAQAQLRQLAAEIESLNAKLDAKARESFQLEAAQTVWSELAASQKEQIVELQQALRGTESQLTTERVSVSKHMNLLAAAESKAVALSAESDGLRAKLDEIRSDGRRAQAELQQSKLELQHAQAELSLQLANLGRLKERELEREEEVVSLRDELRSVKKKASDESFAVSMELRQAKEEAAALKDEAITLRAGLGKLQSDHSRVSKEYESAVGRNAQLDESLRRSEAAAKEAAEAARRLEDDMVGRRDHVEYLQQANHSLEQAAQQLQRELNQLKQRLDDTSADQIATEERHLQEQAALTRQVVAGEQSLAETAKRAQHLEAQLQLGHEALEQQSAELAQQQRATAERQAEADDLHAEQMQRLKDEISRLQLSLDEAKDAQHAMMASNETLTAEVASRQLEVRELRREGSKLASVQDQLRAAEAKSQSLVDLLSEKEEVVRSAGESGPTGLLRPVYVRCRLACLPVRTRALHSLCDGLRATRWGHVNALCVIAHHACS
jgi:chromosome segregation ATPase